MSCDSVYIPFRSTKVKIKNHKYNEYINFAINKVEERGSLNGGGPGIALGIANNLSIGYTPQNKPDKGNKFAIVHITMKNTTSEKQEVNLYDFILIAGKDSIKFVPQNTLMNNRLKYKNNADGYVAIKPQKFMKTQLVYNIPSYYSINTFLIGNMKVDIKYIRK
jgi:hypothetical protein